MKRTSSSFCLSLILHLLLFLSFMLVLTFTPKEKEKPQHDYVPAYTYTGAVPTPTQMAAAPSVPVMVKKAEIKKLDLETSKNGLLAKPSPKVRVKRPYPSSMLAASFASLKQTQMSNLRQTEDDEDPILLIGDMSHTADPLIKLMGRSLSAHFRYPETEGRLGIKGRALVSFVLHPDGHFDRIHLVQSSQNQNLDAAALYAANTAPIVYGADRFLSAPKHFVVGFIFS